MSIRLKCPACGRGLQVKEEHAGRKGRCPGCGQIVPVPAPPASGDDPLVLESELRLKERPPAEPRPEPQLPAWAMPEALASRQQAVSKGARRAPWPLDIWLYPTSRGGMETLAVIAALSLLDRILAQLPFPHLGSLGLGLSALVAGYMVCYLAECIRSSADSGTRSPAMLFGSYDVQDGLLQVQDVVVALLALSVPAGIYALVRWRMDHVFWGIAGISAFCLPMVLLSVVLFDSTSGLNPRYWLTALLHVLLPYVTLLVGLAALGAATAWIITRLEIPVIGHALSSVLIWYAAMVGAHVMGVFYLRHDKRMGWGI